MPATNPHNDVRAVVLTVGLLELVRTAWISDDAAITLRSVLNFLHGFGATFNIDERVQAYTHPLWFLLISALSMLTRNVFASTFILSIALSLLTLWLLLTRINWTVWPGVLAASVLLVSKAFVDFSASGLENPLAHLLIVLIVLASTAASVTTFVLLCSMLLLTRPDLLVLMAPLALLVIASDREPRRTLVRSIAIGVSPVIAWTIFSLYYYGFPFPNTAYAKLGAGMPLADRIVQGGRYLIDSLTRDYVTLPAIGLGLVLAFRATVIEMALACGSVLYLMSVVSAGGDFMSGRFLTAPLLVAAIVIARADLSMRSVQRAGIACALLGLPTLYTVFVTGPRLSDSRIDAWGIADERAYYFQRYGLTAAPPGAFAQPVWTLKRRSVSVTCGGLGFTGLVEGPGAHLIDECALSDPLLAHIPAERTREWRVGHFKRQLPTNYEASVTQRENLLADPQTHAYYDSIRKITRGELLSLDRLREVALVNLGRVPPPDWNMYYATKVPRASAVDSAPARSTKQ